MPEEGIQLCPSRPYGMRAIRKSRGARWGARLLASNVEAGRGSEGGGGRKKASQGVSPPHRSWSAQAFASGLKSKRRSQPALGRPPAWVPASSITSQKSPRLHAHAPFISVSRRRPAMLHSCTGSPYAAIHLSATDVSGAGTMTSRHADFDHLPIVAWAITNLTV